MNIKDVIILKEAADDLNDGKDFYDEKEKGIGDYFWDSLIADIESLFLYAGIHSKQFGSYHMFAKRFPYAIYYEIDEDTVIVIAVLPMRRDPAWLTNKMKGRRK